VRVSTEAQTVENQISEPGAQPSQIARARRELSKVIGIGKVARMTGLGTDTVHKLKREMAARSAVLTPATSA
jgi:hypothetical protein